MKKIFLMTAGIFVLCGCASSRISDAGSELSTGRASVESVSREGAVLKAENNGNSKSIRVNNGDSIVVIRQRKTISPASLIPGEQVEITYSKGNISAICVQKQK